MLCKNQNKTPFPESLSQNICLGNNRCGSDLSHFLFPLCPRPFPAALFCTSSNSTGSEEPFRSEPFYGLERSCQNIRGDFTEDGGLDLSYGGMKLTAGGLDEISYATRLIPATSFVMRDDIFRRTSGGKTYLPNEERFRVKIAKHKRCDKLGKSKRMKTQFRPRGPNAWPTFPPLVCGAAERESPN